MARKRQPPLVQLQVQREGAHAMGPEGEGGGEEGQARLWLLQQSFSRVRRGEFAQDASDARGGFSTAAGSQGASDKVHRLEGRIEGEGEGAGKHPRVHVKRRLTLEGDGTPGPRETKGLCRRGEGCPPEGRSEILDRDPGHWLSDRGGWCLQLLRKDADHPAPLRGREVGPSDGLKGLSRRDLLRRTRERARRYSRRKIHRRETKAARGAQERKKAGGGLHGRLPAEGHREQRPQVQSRGERGSILWRIGDWRRRRDLHEGRLDGLLLLPR